MALPSSISQNIQDKFGPSFKTNKPASSREWFWFVSCNLVYELQLTWYLSCGDPAEAILYDIDWYCSGDLFIPCSNGRNRNLSGEKWVLETDSSLTVQFIDVGKLLMLLGLSRTESLMWQAVPAEAYGSSSQSFQWDQSLCI